MSLPLPEMHPCYFCEIIEGRGGRWNVIHRDQLTITLLNARQFEPGQCVVLPLRHAPTLLELTPRETSAVMTAAQRLARVMVETYAPDGILLYQNNGVGSGQEVPHFHLHVVPRRANSDWGLGPPHIARLEGPGPAAHLDEHRITDSKRETAADLRRLLEKDDDPA